MSKLDDLLAKKKTVVPVLDLSRNVLQSSEELKRLLEKVPEFKMRPIKVRAEDIKTKEKDFSFKLNKKEIKKLLKKNGERDPIYTYADPVPSEMKPVILYELCVVPIDWKMLTTLRPKAKIEEEYFSRMVEMGKLQLKTEQRDRREFMLNNGIKKMKNKSGIVETRLQTCIECSEELCCGQTCTDFSYDLFLRIEPKIPKAKPTSNTNNKNKLNGRKKIINNSFRNKSKKSTQ
ncbi:hypothetical protein DOY81_007601 [Sarcophaga bullata]|nr:hypothetical protein DOY81_007601 [Sarcophaga bullata]